MPPFPPTLIDDALRLNASAIPYHLGAAITAWAGPRHVIELPSGEIDVWSFADAGRCTYRMANDVHGQTGYTWKRRGTLEHHQGSSALHVTWEGHELDVVAAMYEKPFGPRSVFHWVVADDPSVGLAFATALADHAALPPDAVMVFSSGCWSRDRSAFRQIQGADADDLILPEGFLARVRGDARYFLENRAIYERLRLPYKRGLLFAGPPGNGKTACLRVLLRDLGLPILVARSFQSRYGEVQQNVAAAFGRARQSAPCALVLEDLDVLAKGDALSALLNELDGLGADTGILTLATSNAPETLDPALIDRPSRFDRVYRFELPTDEVRRRYLERWRASLEEKLPEGALEDAVARTAGFSFAFLQELVMSATVRRIGAPTSDLKTTLVAELDALAAQRARGARASVEGRLSEEPKPRAPWD